ncbi:Hcp family type VI secretion system effector [Vibrio sp. TRT 2004]|uniref:Hcp family type VI secretion system effector n=1 Tax=Vibrio sp. TRT 2004 TaxID=3418506 RepID=UPI003CF38430
MPQPCYLTIIGTNQGLITRNAGSHDSVGDGAVEPHQHEILVQSIGHLILTPTDRQSGQPSGQRVHGPLKVTCEITSALPLLYNALCQGETIESVSLDWYRMSLSGRQERFFTTSLTNARLSEIQVLLPDSREDKASNINQFVNLFFNYRKIEWAHHMASTYGVDDWRKPVEA